MHALCLFSAALQMAAARASKGGFTEASMRFWAAWTYLALQFAGQSFAELVNPVPVALAPETNIDVFQRKHLVMQVRQLFPEA